MNTHFTPPVAHHFGNLAEGYRRLWKPAEAYGSLLPDATHVVFTGLTTWRFNI